MAWIEWVEEEEASGRLQELYKSVRSRHGVDHILKIHSLNPESLHYHHDLYAHLMRGRSNLSRAEREMIAVVVSTANKCFY